LTTDTETPEILSFGSAGVFSTAYPLRSTAPQTEFPAAGLYSDIVGPGWAVAVTATVTASVTRLPAATTKLDVPATVPAPALNVAVMVVDPPAARAADAGLKETDIPVGKDAPTGVTVPAKPPTEATVTGKLTRCPIATVTA
jgi:hypothetical protein